MSFGRPPSINVGFKVSPPDRGSFPSDHDGLSRTDQPFRCATQTCLLFRRMQGTDDALHELPSQERQHLQPVPGGEQRLLGLPYEKVGEPVCPAQLTDLRDRGLMERDEWQNLGMASVGEVKSDDKDS